MSSATPAIAILGAGPSGLTLARLLQVKNIPYKIFDRDIPPAGSGLSQGGTLDIRTEGGQRALRECGLFDKFQAVARYEGQAFRAFDQDGRVIWDKGAEGRDEMPEVDRRVLREILLASVSADNVRWGMKVEEIFRGDDGKMAIKFADGSVESGFKLVVGADGAWSKTRTLLTKAQPYYSGHTYLNTTITPSNLHYDTLAARIGLGTLMALGSGKNIIAQRMGSGSYNIYAALPLTEHWSRAPDNAQLMHSQDFRQHLVQTYYAEWSKEMTDLITLSDGDWHSWPLCTLPAEALAWESVRGVTLVGDAAHVGLPNGEGVNLGMHDALDLANAIAESGVEDLDEAVRRYESGMLPRGREHIEDGKRMAGMFFEMESPRGFKEWLKEMGQLTE